MSHPVSQWSKSSEVRGSPWTLPEADADALVEAIRTAVVGEGAAIATPFGLRPLVYADYVASGRALGFVEDVIRQQVLPHYGNTHTETSHTGRHTTMLREAAREAVRRAVGAGKDHAVIFTGSGATAAVNKLVRALQLQGRLPSGTAAAAGQAETRRDCAPVVFVGPYEHHSNDLPWRETGARIRRIPLDGQGGICLETLGRELAATCAEVPKYGVFSAASNVTGVKSDVRALARLLHAHGALFFCDYAAGAPYIPISIGETAPGAGDHIDALFLSPHKFIGGPGASGLLVCDKAIFDGIGPTATGGGTVSYVTAGDHCYVDSVERREEAGTPDIVGDIRAGLVLELKERVGAAEIERREADMVARAMRAWASDPNIEMLGPREAERIGVFALNIRCGARKLHYGLVVALLNDLFGIQARGGCSCAGPYAHELLGIDEAGAARHRDRVREGESLLRPGWVRLGFNYFFDDRTTGYIIEAVRFVAAHGALFLSLYRVDPHSGVWSAAAPGARHRPESLFAALLREGPGPADAAGRLPDFDACMQEARQLAARQRERLRETGGQAVADSGETGGLRWFWAPADIAVLHSRLIEGVGTSIDGVPASEAALSPPASSSRVS